MKLFKFLKKLVVFLLVFSIIVGIYALIVNAYVVSSAKKKLFHPKKQPTLPTLTAL